MKVNKEQIINELRSIENQLSPENLCCDGEADRGWVLKRAQELNARRKKLVNTLGYEPTLNELYPELALR